MTSIYKITKNKIFILFLFVSFFGFNQTYELKVKSRVVQDSLLIDLEIENKGGVDLSFGVGQFVFGFDDTTGIDFSAGEIKNNGNFFISSCYLNPTFTMNTVGKYVNFQLNKSSSAPTSCGGSVIISGDSTVKLATLYFPILDCSKFIDFLTPINSGDARVD